MSQIKNFTRKIIKGCLKFILISAFILSFLLAAIIIAVQIPAVQLFAVNKTTDYLSKLLNYPISITGINIDWFDVIVLEGLSVNDRQNAKMIHLKEVAVDFQVLSLMNLQISVDEIILRNGEVNVIKSAKDSSVNISDFINTIRDLQPPRKPGQKPVPFTIEAVGLENMYFSYHDERKPYIKDYFDHFHFSFDSINARVTDLRVIADTFQINVNNLSTRQVETKLKVHELDTRFMLTKNIIELNDLYAKVGDSQIKNYLAFHYDHIDDLSDFNEKVTIQANIDRSEISSYDLAHFAPGMKSFPDRYSLSGVFDGKVGRFRIKNLYLSFGDYSHLKGKVKFDGLPNIEETFMELSFTNSTVYASDLQKYLETPAYNVVKKFGKITGKAQFIGFLNDFVADGSLSTNLGKLDTDINLKINDSLSPKSYYKGHLTTYNFNLGQLIDRPEVKTIEMDGNIEGKGFSLEEAELKLDAEIKEIGYKNYNYKNIITNAQLSDEHFIGEISVRDTNLTFYAKGNVDLRPGRNIFNINSHIEKFNLKPLHLSDVETLIKTDVNLNFRGLTMDDIVGDITFANTYLLYKDHKEIFLDSLIAFTNKIDGQRTFTINSDLLTVNSHGNFDLSTLGLDLQNLYKEYKLAITENKTQVEAYYAQKPKTTKEKYHTDFSINIIDLNAILAIYVPGLYFSPGTIITGNFTSGHTSTLNLNTYIDTFYYKENVFYKTNIELATSKITDSSDVLAMAYVRSKGQHIYGFTETENFVFDGVWDMDSVKFNTSVDQKRSNNKAYLKGTLSLQEDHKTLQLQDSYLNLLNKKWRITESSTIQFLPNEILVKLLEVSNNNQTITFKGPISKTDDKESYLDIKNFQIENLNPLIEESANIKGSLTGNIVIKDIFENLDINGNINLLNLHVDDFLIGNVDGLSRWDGGKKQLDIKVGVVRENDKIIDLKGYLKPGLNETKEEVNFIATLDNADLSILSPLLKGVMSDLSGNVTGVFDIQGSIRNLKLKGRGDVNDGKFKVDYLGTTYTFNDYIYLDDNLIGFKKLLLKDADGNQAIIDGGIYHDNFRDFMVSIKGYMNNFQVLNTTEKDNNLFYGKAMVSGDVEMLGAFTNLEIKANAISEKGTKIFIPLNSYSEIEQQNYIRFTSFKDAKEKDKEAHKDHIDLSGISMDFNLEITPDAYCEIIFDKKAGDIIRGYGKGNLKLKIDTRGDFNMYGNYTITEGAYNFTLAGIVNKAFKIEPNSTISWMGDPYEGILDIKAIHKLDVSLRPLLDSIEASKPANQKKYPVNVVLDVEGNLLSPEISLDIDILRYGDLGTYVAEFESKIQNNEQELNRQVFSLMVLGSLSRENSFSGISSNSSTNNLSELLSNQLSSWLSQVDDNLQIDIDLNSMDKDILNNFQLRLSYTLLDGRLRITRDGNFQNVNNANEAQVSNLAGEWTVEYLLTEEGKLRLKLYNRINQNNSFTNITNNTNTSAGFSILHTQSFNNLKEFFNFSKKKKVEEIIEEQKLNEEEEENNENDNKSKSDTTFFQPKNIHDKREEIE